MPTDSHVIPAERSHMFSAVLLLRIGAVLAVVITAELRQTLPEWMTSWFLGIASPLLLYNLAALLWRKRLEYLLACHPWLLAVDLAIAVAILGIGGGWRNSYFEYTLTTVILFTIFLNRRGAWSAAGVFIIIALIKDPTGELPPMETFGTTNWDMRIGAALFYLYAGLIVGYFDSLLIRIERLYQERIIETERRVHLEEQSRLALELHDGAKQMVTALLLRSRALLRRTDRIDPIVRGELEWLWRGLSYLQTELTHLVGAFQAQRNRQSAGWEVAEIVLEEIQLMEILTRGHWVAVFSDLGKVIISARQRDALRHFLTEALMNTWKHAGVATGTLELSRQNGEIEISVSDQGCGFEPDSLPVQHTTGLQSLQRRAQELGGRLEVVSNPGRGCRLTLRFPTPPQDA